MSLQARKTQSRQVSRNQSASQDAMDTLVFISASIDNNNVATTRRDKLNTQISDWQTQAKPSSSSSTLHAWSREECLALTRYMLEENVMNALVKSAAWQKVSDRLLADFGRQVAQRGLRNKYNNLKSRMVIDQQLRNSREKITGMVDASADSLHENLLKLTQMEEKIKSGKNQKKGEKKSERGKNRDISSAINTNSKIASSSESELDGKAEQEDNKGGEVSVELEPLIADKEEEYRGNTDEDAALDVDIPDVLPGEVDNIVYRLKDPTLSIKEYEAIENRNQARMEARRDLQIKLVERNKQTRKRKRKMKNKKEQPDLLGVIAKSLSEHDFSTEFKRLRKTVIRSHNAMLECWKEQQKEVEKERKLASEESQQLREAILLLVQTLTKN